MALKASSTAGLLPNSYLIYYAIVISLIDATD